MTLASSEWRTDDKNDIMTSQTNKRNHTGPITIKNKIHKILVILVVSFASFLNSYFVSKILVFQFSVDQNDSKAIFLKINFNLSCSTFEASMI